jgi:SulP family sulfate permease
VRTVIGATALAALVFSSDLAVALPQGVALLLFSGFALGLGITSLSSYPGIVAQPQDAVAAVGGLMAASIFASLPATMALADKVLNVLAGIALTTLLAGVLFLAMGHLRWGALVRFTPYPVIGGFLAGSGWLFVTGSFVVMTGDAAGLSQPAALLEPAALVVWAPGAVFALALIAVLRRWRHYLIVPGMLFGAIALFYLVLAAGGLSVAEASARGWLLGPFPEGTAWQALVFASASRVEWTILAAELPKMLTIAGVSIVGLMLNRRRRGAPGGPRRQGHAAA